jgi:hypothetical protein
MLVCYYPVKNGLNTNNKNFKFRIINQVDLSYNIDKSLFDSIIEYILVDCCSSAVLGYDKYFDKYWCKKYENSTCYLHIEIKIKFKGYKNTEINLIPLIGKNEDINLFVNDFHESIDIYQTSSFIRDTLNRR